MSDEFDDVNYYRRKIEDLEQQNGRLGLQIGVLKQERAHLWLTLQEVLGCFLETKQWNTVIVKAQAVLNEIKIS